MTTDSERAIRGMKDEIIQELKEAGAEAGDALKGVGHSTAQSAAAARRQIEDKLDDARSGLGEVSDAVASQVSNAA